MLKSTHDNVALSLKRNVISLSLRQLFENNDTAGSMLSESRCRSTAPTAILEASVYKTNGRLSSKWASQTSLQKWRLILLKHSVLSGDSRTKSFSSLDAVLFYNGAVNLVALTMKLLLKFPTTRNDLTTTRNYLELSIISASNQEFAASRDPGKHQWQQSELQNKGFNYGKANTLWVSN